MDVEEDEEDVEETDGRVAGTAEDMEAFLATQV